MSAKIFSAPKSRFIFSHSNLNHPKSNLDSIIEQHHFNCAVEVIIPGQTTLPPDLEVPRDSYVEASISLSHLLEENFFSSFIKKGRLYALSTCARIDHDTVVAVAPPGQLRLAVDKDTYEQLGLEGESSPYDKGLRYDIAVDMAATNFFSSKPKYERVRWSLNERLGQQSLALTWLSSDGVVNIEQLGVALPGAQRRPIRETRKVLAGIRWPVLSQWKGEEMEQNAEAFYEWLGMLTCGADCTSHSADDYSNTYCCDLPLQQIGSGGLRLILEGFITGPQVARLCRALCNWLLSTDQDVPYVALSAWGYDDTPVSWGNCKHGHLVGGENNFTVVIFPNGTYWVFTVLGTYDEYS